MADDAQDVGRMLARVLKDSGVPAVTEAALRAEAESRRRSAEVERRGAVKALRAVADAWEGGRSTGMLRSLAVDELRQRAARIEAGVEEL